MADVSLSFSGQDFVPLPCGALFWPGEQTLLVADLHLEKGSAFARQGWLLPPYDSLESLRRLAAAAAQVRPRHIVALGDSFHDSNGPSRLLPEALDLLLRLLRAHDWLWVTGNHDGDSGVEIGGRAVAEVEMAGIWLRHEAQTPSGGPEISGHFHPKVAMELRAGVRVSRRCFAMAAERLVLPAYGAYAGGLSVDDPAFAVALGCIPDAVVPLAGGIVRIPAAKRRNAA
ncbi:ligase-associated DNA damage response endonuclease PdeM [Sandaracinobacteroides hominis]|uniref:ligase-associated DNA damage response endonuclease PdeM n=1 Tax=Sandaracinobacteroides hominis TaxID=2780086 RepID=UPI0018F390D5|nr:ligase-associated DNA damage response endonuclease PdeM [Sandaracinobacteroides hominis]